MLLPKSSTGTVALAVTNRFLPFYHPERKASPYKLEAAEKVWAGEPDDPYIHMFSPNNVHHCVALKVYGFTE